jgi:tRNA dimethylallyltransferase
MTDPSRPLLVIAGPTATGKTAAAVELATRLDGELVGADSVQVYRGFDIGSAKPNAEELRGVAHHLIDVIDPDEEIDAAAYAARADGAIEEIRQRGRLPIVVGGTGLWIRALVRGLVDLPPVDPVIRERLEHEAKMGGAPALHARLADLDPLTSEAVHPNDALRIVRALEVYEQTGTPLGTLRAEHALGAPRFATTFVVLDMGRDAHTEVIETRAQNMLDAGWADEVRALRERWGDEVRPFGAVGYREVLAHVRDALPIEDTLRAIRKSTRIYARRQRTWFNGEPGVNWRCEREELLAPQGVARIARELES